MLCGWEDNRRSGVAPAMHHRLRGLSTYGLNGLCVGDEHLAYRPSGHGTFTLPYDTLNFGLGLEFYGLGLGLKQSELDLGLGLESYLGLTLNLGLGLQLKQPGLGLGPEIYGLTNYLEF